MLTIEQLRKRLKRMSPHYDLQQSDHEYWLYYGSHHFADIYTEDGEWKIGFPIDDGLGLTQIAIIKQVLPVLEVFLDENSGEIEK